MSNGTNERELIDDGLQSEFWRWFANHKDQEWGIAGARYAEAVSRAAEKGDADAVMFLRMVVFAQKEIDRLFAYPKERLNAMKAQTPGLPNPSRRGPGL